MSNKYKDFFEAYCENLTKIDLSNFDTKNVTNMSSMFCNCNNLISIYFGSKFTTKKVPNFLLTSFLPVIL